VDPLDRLRIALADRYAVQREIGRGGMAIVYLAQDLRHKRDVAIKVLKPEFAMAVSTERFLQEIQIEAQLKHPYILPLFDSGEAEGLLYYVMPYVAGQSLQARLRLETQLPLDEALQITSEIAEALAYAHARGVVHRDVKPGNILLDESHALLADFGIARAISELGGSRLSDTGMVVGTPEYMSPEQCSNTGKIDGRSDIYALGCVLYEMLSGEPPFTGPTARAIIARHLQDRPRSLRVVRSTIPEHVQEAIEIALAKVPADRFTTAVQFVSALDSQGETSTAIRKARTARRRRLVVRGRWLVALATVTAGLVLANSMRTTRASDASRATNVRSALVMVSPFQTQGNDTLAKSVAQSLSDAIVDTLANINGLRVVATSAEGPRVTDSLLGRAEVSLIVSGSLDRRGNQLKAIGRVSDAVTRGQLFSQGQQASSDVVQILESDLVERIVRFVRRYVGTEVRARAVAAGTKDSTARSLWSRAMSIIGAIGSPEAHSLPVATIDRLAVADSLLGEAIRRDPRWVGPHIARGWAYLGSASMHGSEGQRDSIRIAVHLKAIAAANAAIQIAPADPDAHELRGVALVGLWFEAPSERADSIGHDAEVALRRAISLDLNVARAWEALSTYYLFVGRFEEARHAIAQALQADAFLLSEPAILLQLITADLNLERYADAQETCARGARWYPLELSFVRCHFVILGWTANDLESARRAWQVGLKAENQASPAQRNDIYRTNLLMTAAILARAGHRDSANSLLRTFVRTRKGPVDLDGFAGDEAYVRLLLGQEDEAIALLKTFLRNNWAQRGYVVRTPWFRPIHRNPTFVAITEQLQ
jgi:serine/threonine protein kinase/tetratricopeptide (TPR) repeat protein